MSPDELQTLCLSLPGANEEHPFSRTPEQSVFKVGGKIFAASNLSGDPLQVTIKHDPEFGVQLRAAHPEILPARYYDKRHWSSVTLDGALTDERVHDLILASYRLVGGRTDNQRPA